MPPPNQIVNNSDNFSLITVVYHIKLEHLTTKPITLSVFPTLYRLPTTLPSQKKAPTLNFQPEVLNLNSSPMVNPHHI